MNMVVPSFALSCRSTHHQFKTTCSGGSICIVYTYFTESLAALSKQLTIIYTRRYECSFSIFFIHKTHDQFQSTCGGFVYFTSKSMHSIHSEVTQNTREINDIHSTAIAVVQSSLIRRIIRFRVPAVADTSYLCF